MGFTRNADGWTDVTPTAGSTTTGSRIMYVSTTGNDGTGKIWSTDDGDYDTVIGPDPRLPLQPSNVLPFLTPATAMANSRNGEPDWVLYKCGDTFDTTISLFRSGKSPEDRNVIASYGYDSAARPLFRIGAVRICNVTGTVQYSAVMGLYFWAHTRDEDGGFFVAGDRTTEVLSKFRSLGSHVLVEDVVIKDIFKFEFGAPQAGPPRTNDEWNRCMILETIGLANDPTGLFGQQNDGLIFNECMWDKCGWEGSSRNTSYFQPDIFTHNLYMAAYKTGTAIVIGQPFTMRNCITMRACSNGLQQRPGGRCENNLFVLNPIHGFQGENTKGEKNYTIGNVFIWSDEIETNTPVYRGTAWDIKGNSGGHNFTGNYILHSQPPDYVTSLYTINPPGTQRESGHAYNKAIQLSLYVTNQPHTNLTISNNVIYKWYHNDSLPDNEDLHGQSILEGLSPTIENNIWWTEPATGTNQNWQDDELTPVDEDRNPVTYVDYVNGVYKASPSYDPDNPTATFDDFVAALRAQRRGDWDVAYATQAIASWIKAGYASGDPPPPPDPEPGDPMHLNLPLAAAWL